MGATYTRQSSYTDGDVITAAHTNDEFNQLLAAFASSTGHSHDGTAGEGGPITKLLSNSLTFGAGTAGTDITVTFDGETNDGVLKWMEDEDYFEFSDDILIASTEKLQFRDTAIYINSSADGQLDIIADTEIQIAATTVDINGNVDISGTLTIGGAGISEAELEILDGATVTTTEINVLDGDTGASSVTVADADRVVLNDNGTMKQVAVTDLSAYFDDEITAMPNLTSVGTLGTLTVDNIIINGTTIGHTSDTDALTIASNGNVTVSQNLTVTGDLTISGDDLVMGTNTSGHILVADGTNFNPTAVGDLSEISTIANDDVFLAVDTSGGGLKKVARSTVVSGLATSAAISNVVEDTTPQLGGNLDTNSHNILIDDAHFIGDENGNEQIIFQTTSSAVNQFDITNAATGNAPELSATGGDTNISLKITPKGSGQVLLDGNVGVESGLIDLKNSGSRSQIKFYCESGNAHAQTLQAAPHSESASNTLTLPSTGGNVDLVSTASTATLTNKTLTDPVITNMTGSTITLDSAGDIVLDADGGDIFFKDGGTTFGSATNTSGNLIIKSGTTTAMTFDGANVTFAGTVTIGSAGISEAELEILDGATVTTAELNILDGVTSTAAELNILDGVTSTAAELNILDGATATATELNIMDGDTSASATTLVDADRVVTNDNGTMKQVALSDVKTYLSSAGFSSEDPTALAIALG